MKKHLIYIIFLTFSLLMLGFIFSSLNKVKSDIYTLISLDFNESVILESMQSKNAKNIMFLSSDFKLLQELSSSEIFSEFKLTYDIDQKFLTALNNTSLATINRKIFNQILYEPEQFFASNASNLFNPFNYRIIPNDFLNFSSYSTLLMPSNLSLDLKTQSLKATYNNQIYYFAYGVLDDNFSSSKLLEFYKTAKENAKENEDELLIIGSEIFSGFAKDEGNKESIIMGSLSLVMIGILLILAFGSYSIFKLIIVIIFSFLCGLSGGFLIFDEITLFSIVISISLIGLILDFAMHFLGYAQGRVIYKGDIRRFLKIFLIGLFITILGYALFILAPIGFLKQIAVISIFSLVGAFIATYFLLPYILENSKFKSYKIFDLVLDGFIKFNFYILQFKRILIFFMAIFVFGVIIFFIYILPSMDFKDDIRNYSSLNDELLAQSKKFLQISQNPFQSSFIALNFSPNDDKIAKEIKLLSELNITNYQGASKILLSQNEQIKLKLALKNYAKNEQILKAYKELGIDLNLVKNSLENISQFSPISFDEFNSQFDKNNPLEPFIYDGDTNLIFISSDVGFSDEFDLILQKYNASYFNLTQSISNNFTIAKEYAIYLKLLAYVCAFGIFLFFFSFARACVMVGIILFGTFVGVAIMLLVGVSFNIFTIFGFILASTIGVDYVLFASNLNLALRERYFGIILASLTSIISFGMLGFSNTYAVFSFGVSTALCMFLLAYFALLYATYNSKIK